MANYDHMKGSGKTIWSGKNFLDQCELGASSADPNYPLDHLHFYERWYQWRSGGVTTSDARLFISGLPNEEPINFFALLHTNLTQSATWAVDKYGDFFMDAFTNAGSWNVTAGAVDPSKFGPDGLTIDAATTATLSSTTIPLFKQGARYVLRIRVDQIDEGSVLVYSPNGMINELTGLPQTDYAATTQGDHYFWLAADNIILPTIALKLDQFRGTLREIAIWDLQAAGPLVSAYPPIIPFGSMPMGAAYGEGTATTAQLGTIPRYSWQISDYDSPTAIGIRINDSGNPEGHLSLGRVWVSQAIQFYRSVDHTVSEKPTRKSKNRSVDITMSSLDKGQAKWTLLKQIVERCRDRDVFVVLNPHEPETAMLDCVHGFVSEKGTRRGHDQFAVQLEIEERYDG